IRIRDPNQGGKDITEEIMAGGSGSRNSTPPVGPPSSTPTPPQQLSSSQTPEQQQQQPPPPPPSQPQQAHSGDDKPKLEPVVQKSSSPGLAQPAAPMERLEANAPVTETSLTEPEPAFPASPTAPVTLPLTVVNTSDRPSARESAAAAAVAVVAAVLSPSAFGGEHKHSLASPQIPNTDKPPSDPPRTVAVSPAPTPKALNGLTDPGVDIDNTAHEPSLLSPAAPQPQAPASAYQEASLSETLPSDVRPEVPIAAELAPMAPLAVVPVTLTSTPAPALPVMLPPGLPPLVQATLETDTPNKSLDSKDTVPQIGSEAHSGITEKIEPQQYSLTRKSPTTADYPTGDQALQSALLSSSPVPLPSVLSSTTAPAPAIDPETDAKPATPEENGEVELELMRNGAGHTSETESSDSGVTPGDKENSTGAPQDMEDLTESSGKRQYERDFLLGFQFMPACVQKPEGLPPISDVVLDKAAATQEIIMNVSVNDDVQLKKSENAWKPGLKREGTAEDTEAQKTQELFRKVRSILNKLTPQKFNQLMKQVTDLTIDTEERLKGVIDLVFEKAIDEPSFSVAYGNMCRCLATLLLNRCQKEFEKDKVDDVVFERKQKELDSAASPRMDQYFNQMEKIVKERKTSSRIRFMLQDIIDLRLHNWVSRRADQGPKTIEQIHKEAKIEEQEEQRKVHQQLLSKESKRRPDPREQREQRMQREETWNTVPMTKNSRTIDPNKIPKISKVRPSMDEKIQLGPRAQVTWVKGSSGGAKASDSELSRTGSSLNRYSALQSTPSHQSSTTPPQNSEFDSRRTLGRYQTQGENEARKPLISVPPSSRPGSFIRGDSSKELLESQTTEEPRREREEAEPRRTSVTEDKMEPERTRIKEPVKPEPVAQTPERPVLSEEELERKSKSIIDEFLHINDYKEAIQCVDELDLGPQLHSFVRVGVESTLERSHITRDHMGQLLFQLVQQGILPKCQFYKGFLDTLEQADDMAIDIPHIWLYLAELLSPVLRDGGFSMRELFSELSKPLLPVGRAGILISEILHMLCKQLSHRTVGSLWRESGLNWTDFLPDGEDVQAFIEQQKLQFILSDDSIPAAGLSKRNLSPEELSRQLERLLLEDMASDEQIFDWVEANLDESQMSSSPFLRALMTAVCKAAVKDDNPNCPVDTAIIQRRLPVLLKYLNSDTERQLQALYALQALIVALDQPPNLLRMFFDCLYDEDVISEDAFYKWETSKDPAEQQGKGVALKSVTAFFTWLREAEEESEDN
ncbi:unnamed protein product, partial [Lampetra planeri]